MALPETHPMKPVLNQRSAVTQPRQVDEIYPETRWTRSPSQHPLLLMSRAVLGTEPEAAKGGNQDAQRGLERARRAHLLNRTPCRQRPCLTSDSRPAFHWAVTRMTPCLSHCVLSVQTYIQRYAPTAMVEHRGRLPLNKAENKARPWKRRRYLAIVAQGLSPCVTWSQPPNPQLLGSHSGLTQQGVLLAHSHLHLGPLLDTQGCVLGIRPTATGRVLLQNSN